jgi:hypothetical protein
MAGKTIALDAPHDRVRWQKPANTMFDAMSDPLAPIEYVLGHYALTNVRTKRGAYVYEWMGWEGEIVS